MNDMSNNSNIYLNNSARNHDGVNNSLLTLGVNNAQASSFQDIVNQFAVRKNAELFNNVNDIQKSELIQKLLQSYDELLHLKRQQESTLQVNQTQYVKQKLKSLVLTRMSKRSESNTSIDSDELAARNLSSSSDEFPLRKASSESDLKHGSAWKRAHRQRNSPIATKRQPRTRRAVLSATDSVLSEGSSVASHLTKSPLLAQSRPTSPTSDITPGDNGHFFQFHNKQVFDIHRQHQPIGIRRPSYANQSSFMVKDCGMGSSEEECTGDVFLSPKSPPKKLPPLQFNGGAIHLNSNCATATFCSSEQRRCSSFSNALNKGDSDENDVVDQMDVDKEDDFPNNESEDALGQDAEIRRPSNAPRKESVVGELPTFYRRKERLARCLSDPSLEHPAKLNPLQLGMANKGNVGVAYDELMLKHDCSCKYQRMWHPENPTRIAFAWDFLLQSGLASCCVKLPSRKATLAEISLVHAPDHLERFCSANNTADYDLACGGRGINEEMYWSDTISSQAVRLAAGCCIDLAIRVASGDFRNGFALVRPPGHHAYDNQAVGFCFVNNVAVAAKVLLDQNLASKIVIFDWDIHHGNSTQKVFYDSCEVLYISMHRYEKGNWFPGTGHASEVGEGRGRGFNVNIPFNSGLVPPMSDVDYMVAWQCLVMPIISEFEPDIILVSAGFDGCIGHPNPLGGYEISPLLFGYLTKYLLSINYKVVLALEGGFHAVSLAESVKFCIDALLNNELEVFDDDKLVTTASDPARDDILAVYNEQKLFWSNLNLNFMDYSLAGVINHNQQAAQILAVAAAISSQAAV